MLIGLVSAKGSPGVTTTTLALASQWPRHALVVEADPFGGDIRAGLGGGSWPASAGIADAVVDLRSAGPDETLRRRAHRPAPHARPVLAGLGCVGQAATVPWTQIGSALGRLRAADTVADCGRFALADGVTSLLNVCDALVLVTGSSLRSVRAAARVAPMLREQCHAGPHGPGVGVLVVGPDEPYSIGEIADGCGLAAFGEVPRDARSAAVWSDGVRPCRTFERAPLQRAARRIAGRLFRPDLGRDGAA